MDLVHEPVDDKAQFAWFASVSWDTPRRVGQPPQIERRNRTKKSKRLLVEFDAFEFLSTVPAWFSTVRPIRCNLNCMKKNSLGASVTLISLGRFENLEHTYLKKKCWEFDIFVAAY